MLEVITIVFAAIAIASFTASICQGVTAPSRRPARHVRKTTPDTTITAEKA